MFLWLCCEGWVRFGPYGGLRFDEAHNVITDTGEPVAIFNGGRDLHWQTPKSHTGFRWERPVITTARRGPFVDRVYIIHAPDGFEQQCQRIRGTCKRALVVADSGGGPARSEVVQLARSEANGGDTKLRLSVYTRDQELTADLEGLEAEFAKRVAYFGVHWIAARGPRPWGTSRRTGRCNYDSPTR